MIFGESPHKYCRINSSRSNLACEELLLGMQAEGHEDPPNQSSTLGSEPSLHDDICDVPSHFLQGTSATRWGFSLVRVRVKLD
jgi:hypothetical protein